MIPLLMQLNGDSILYNNKIRGSNKRVITVSQVPTVYEQYQVVALCIKEEK